MEGYQIVPLIFFSPSLIAGGIIALKTRSVLPILGTLASSIFLAIAIVISSSIWLLIGSSAAKDYQPFEGFGGGIAFTIFFMPLAGFLGVVTGAWLASMFYLRHANQIAPGNVFFGLFQIISGLSAIAIGGLLIAVVFYIISVSPALQASSPGGAELLILCCVLSGLLGGTVSAFVGRQIATWLL